MCQKMEAVAFVFDDEYEKMKEVFDICINAGVSVPSEVTDYFDDNQPEENLPIKVPIHDVSDGIEIYQGDLPSKFYKIKILLNH